MQAWQLLCILIPLFLPKHLVLWYLKAHLQRHADKKYDCFSLCEGIRGILHCSTVLCVVCRSEIGKYAAFCRQSVDRSIASGSRQAPPSRMEVLSIILRNAYQHSQPMSVPVHLPDNTYQVR